MIRKIWSWVYPVLIVGFVLTIAVVLGSKSAQNSQDIGAQRAENKTQDTQISSLVSSLADANKKLIAAGLPTVPVIVQDSGQSGRDGTDGRSVQSTICQPSGTWLVSYDDGTTAPAGAGCIGKQGAAGVGVDGADGQNGTDGQNGSDGATGDPGPAGPQGAPGADGADGSAGQPPVSWTYTDTLGAETTCSRADPFDPAAPTYTCAPTPVSPPAEGATPSD